MTTLWRKGVAASDIAAEFGDVSRSGVLGKLHRLGLTRKADKAPKPARPPSAPRAAPRPAKVAEPRDDLGIEVDAIVELPADSSPFACAIVDLEPGQCRYVLGPVVNAIYCGAPTFRNSWCRRHYRLVYSGARLPR